MMGLAGSSRPRKVLCVRHQLRRRAQSVPAGSLLLVSQSLPPQQPDGYAPRPPNTSNFDDLSNHRMDTNLSEIRH